MKIKGQTISKIPLHNKIVLILFGLFFLLILFEIGLRMGGFVMLSLQEHKNRLSLKQKGAWRIMCLGESTTQDQYPRFLEEILNRRNIGIKFSVIDKGLVGTNTTAILSAIEENLDKYKPDMVVAMMGANDNGIYAPHQLVITSKTALFFKSFRTYKLARLLWLHILTKAKETGLYKPKDKQLFSKTNLLLSGIGLKEGFAEKKKFVLQEELSKKAIKFNLENDSEYVKLGFFYRGQHNYKEAEEAFNKAIELNRQNDSAYVGLGWICIDQDRFNAARQAFNKAIELIPRNIWVYDAIDALCLDKSKSEIFKEDKQRAKWLRQGSLRSSAFNNYLKLKQVLDKRNVRLVCVQYPMLSLEPLKKTFKDGEGVIFVDNKGIFQDAIKRHGYKVYFKDEFAVDFGHCTPEGNQLLAKNIADVILKEVFGRNP